MAFNDSIYIDIDGTGRFTPLSSQQYNHAGYSVRFDKHNLRSLFRMGVSALWEIACQLAVANELKRPYEYEEKK